jgi:hypothetical protein
MRSTLAWTLAAIVFATPAWSAPPACTGTLSGSVKARFDCYVSVLAGEDDRVFLTISTLEPVEGVPSTVPGSFEITGLLAPGTYTLDDLGVGKASVAAEGGTLFTATKTSGQRGEVRLVLEAVRKDPARKGAWTVHGTYRARLLPVGAGKTGEVVVEARF